MKKLTALLIIVAIGCGCNLTASKPSLTDNQIRSLIEAQTQVATRLDPAANVRLKAMADGFTQGINARLAIGMTNDLNFIVAVRDGIRAGLQ